MTSNQLLARVRTNIDETETGGTVSDNEVFAALTEAQQAVFNTLIRLIGVNYVPDALRPLLTSEELNPASQSHNTYDSQAVYTGVFNIPDYANSLVGVQLKVTQSSTTYTIDRMIPTSQMLATTGWIWRGAMNGSIPMEAYYYAPSPKTIIAMAAEVSLNNLSNMKLVINYVSGSLPDISSSVNPKLQNVDNLLVDYATAVLMGKMLKGDLASLYTQKFQLGLANIGGSNGVPNQQG